MGAGVPSRFTPINVRTDSGTLDVGVKQIYQAAWNPIGGLGDTYSNQIWLSISDPILTGHPFSGEMIPIRSSWEVETNGINSSVQVPNDAIMWNPDSRMWDKVGNEISAKSKITYDLKFNQWHHGPEMNMNDIIYSYTSYQNGVQKEQKMTERMMQIFHHKHLKLNTLKESCN